MTVTFVHDPLSSDLRARVITWRYEDHRTVSEIADLTGPHKLDRQDLSFIHSVVDANPSLYLDEIARMTSPHTKIKT